MAALQRRKPAAEQMTCAASAGESTEQGTLRRQTLPIMCRFLGFEVERNAVLAALGAVVATGALLGFQYAFYIVFLAPAPLEEGDLPFIT
eukprot:COSAG02_NODE_835_length_16654_cov_52.747569_3_plen_90_part_00